MQPNEPTRVKVRFRLPNGEEFEAEGTPEFIAAQRDYFLTLIGQSPFRTANTHLQEAASPLGAAANTGGTPLLPAALGQPAAAFTPVAYPPHSELYLWEKLLKEDGNTLTLRHASKLAPQEVASLLLAGARVLLKKPAYPALELARSLKTCGVEGRLDRLLAPEIQAGRIRGEGNKRSRTYKLTQEGFARAFVLAERILKEQK